MLRACGITAFVTPLSSASDRTGSNLQDQLLFGDGIQSDAVNADRCATGNLKCEPESFVVVEIDPTKQRTDVEAYVFPVEHASPMVSPVGGDVDGVADSIAAEEGPDREGHLSQTPSPVQSRGGEEEDSGLPTLQLVLKSLRRHTPVMRGTFGSAAEVAKRAATSLTQECLHLLVQDIRPAVQSKGGSCASCEAGSSAAWWRTTTYALDGISDKLGRQLTHLMVRRCFPHVRTCGDDQASPPSVKQENSVVICTFDPHFIFFAATLGAAAALCLAQWQAAAQAERQMRRLPPAMRAAVRGLDCRFQGADVTATTSVCYTTFETLEMTLQRFSQGEAALLFGKDVRRQVHELLRRFYPFVTCQVRDGRVTLRPRVLSEERLEFQGRRRTRAEMDDSAESGLNSTRPTASDGASPRRFLQLIVKKRNLETAEMRLLLSEYFGVAERCICIAGMKDKKAITVQRCSVPITNVAASARCRVDALLSHEAHFPVVLRCPADPQGSYVVLERAEAAAFPVQLGQLYGNWFSVRIRGVRWASAAERKAWRSLSQPVVEPLESLTDAERGVGVESLKGFVERRFAQSVEKGFVNYFGQQRFGESITHVDDHTGVHLFAGRWVAAVRSLFRACPDVYAAFPAHMEPRFVPNKFHDAQVMTQALRQTYRMYFSDHTLSSADVSEESDFWSLLCEKALTEGVPYHLRSLWVHAGQSAFFNVAASFVVAGSISSAIPAEMKALTTNTSPKRAAVDMVCPGPADKVVLPSSVTPLPYAVLASAQLALGGFQVKRRTSGAPSDLDETSAALWEQWKTAAEEHALLALRWTRDQAFEQKRVAGVPVPGSWRAILARPTDAQMEWETGDSAELVADDGASASNAEQPSGLLPTLRVSFTLPSSCYATVFLREVFGCDQWW